MVRFGERPVVPEHQPDAVLNQDNPVSGMKYTVLNTTKNVRLYQIVISCTWTVQPSPLEIHLTIDGVSVTASVANPVSATVYRYTVSPTDYLGGGEAYMEYQARSIKVEAEITGGTVSNLYAHVRYAKF